MNTIKIFEFLKNQWLGSILIIIWIFSVLVYQNNRENLLIESGNLKDKIEKLEKELTSYKKKGEEFKKIDTIIVTKIKKIKDKEYVQIKVIDSLPISGLQQFFTDRYK